MDIIEQIRQKAKGKQKTIVLPEYNDKRVVEAAKIIQGEGIAKVLLLTKDMIDPKIRQNTTTRAARAE